MRGQTLDPTSDAAFALLEALFAEVASLFPDEYMHIGADEVGFSLNDDGKMNKSRGKSEFFGEIGLMSDDHLVTATAIAKTACECYALSKARFDELVRESMQALMSNRDMPVRTRSKTEVAEASYAKMGVKTKQKTSLVSESFKTVHRCGALRSSAQQARRQC